MQKSLTHPHQAIKDAARLIERVEERAGADIVTCPVCGHDREVRSTQVSEDPCRNDIRLKCPHDPEADGETGCGFWTSHGIPISRERYEEEMRVRERIASQTGKSNPRHVDAVMTDVPAEHSAVEDRLAALGYVER